MATTFREFITECELYEYSKEYYELMKEGYELDLMGMYLRNQEFLKEDAPMLEAAGMTVSAAYFTESATDTDFVAITEAFGKKQEGFLNIIKEKINALIKKLIRFLNKIKEKINTKRQAAAIAKMTGGIVDKKTIEKILPVAKKLGIVGAVLGGTALGAAGLKFASDVLPEEKNIVKQFLSLIKGKGNLSKPLPIAPTMEEAMDDIEKMVKFASHIYGTEKTADGIEIRKPTNTFSIPDDPQILSGYVTRLTELFTKYFNADEKLANAGYAKTSAAISDLTTYISNVLSAYTEVYGKQKSAQNTVASISEEDSGSPKNTKEESEKKPSKKEDDKKDEESSEDEEGGLWKLRQEGL